jgi:ketosteroid isomerase-like protein
MVLSVWLVAIALVQVPGGTAAADADVTTLALFETDWNAAHVRGNAAALEHLFADDVVKADALGMFTSGRMKFDRYETSETKFRVYDASAIATGRLRRTRQVAGATVDDDWMFTKVYLRRAGRWQVVSFHASNTVP